MMLHSLDASSDSKDDTSKISKLEEEIQRLKSQIKAIRDIRKCNDHLIQDELLKTVDTNVIDLPQTIESMFLPQFFVKILVFMPES